MAIKYFNSDHVKVFPAAFRGNIETTNKAIDPEARLFSEYNITHIGSKVNGHDSYIVDYKNSVLMCVIGGYYFELKLNANNDLTEADLKGKYLIIRLRGRRSIEDEETVNSQTISTKVLDNLDANSNTTILDVNGKFQGLGVADTSTDESPDAFLMAFTSDGIINYEEFLPDLLINCGTGTKNVGEQDKQVNSLCFGYKDDNKATENGAFAQGKETQATGKYSHSEGNKTQANSDYAHAEGVNTFTGVSAIGAHAEGEGSTTKGAYGAYSHVEGYQTKTKAAQGSDIGGKYAHAEGYQTEANSMAAHAEGKNTKASGDYSHAEGEGNGNDKGIASGRASHTEGYYVIASGDYAHAEGNGTAASEESAHAEGYKTTASGKYSHAEGEGNGNELGKASGKGAHTEGYYTVASGDYSHAEGYQTTAFGDYSHAEGLGTIASRNNQTVVGRYNKKEDGEFIVGIGNNNTARNNALVINGNKTSIYEELYINKLNNTNILKVTTDETTLNSNSIKLTGYADSREEQLTINQDNIELALVDDGPGRAKLYKSDNKTALDLNADNVKFLNITKLSLSTPETDTAVLFIKDTTDNNKLKLGTKVSNIILNKPDPNSNCEININSSQIKISDNIYTYADLYFKNDISSGTRNIKYNGNTFISFTNTSLNLGNINKQSTNLTAQKSIFIGNDSLESIYLQNKKVTLSLDNGHLDVAVKGNVGDGATLLTFNALGATSGYSQLSLASQIENAAPVITFATMPVFTNSNYSNYKATQVKFAQYNANSHDHQGANANEVYIFDEAGRTRLNNVHIKNRIWVGTTWDKSSVTGSNYHPIAINSSSNTAVKIYGKNSNNLEISGDNCNLTTAGQITCNNIQAAGGKFKAESNGAVYAETFYANSDATLKENLKVFNSDKSILDLPIYRFDYINGAKDQIGCLAQDLQKICPELVHEDNKGLLTIQETKLVYLLIDEVKKLKEEIKSLKK